MRAQDCRLFYILEGKGVFRLGGGQVIPFETGSLLLIQPNQSYALAFDSDPARRIEISFDYGGDYADEEVERPVRPDTGRALEGAHRTVCFEDAPCLNGPLALHGLTDLAPVFLGMLAVYERKRPRWRMRLNTGFTGLLLRLLEREDDPGNGLVEGVIGVVSARYMTPLTNAGIAAELGYHPNYLNSVFLKRMGVTIHQYLMRYRVDKAICLLNGSSLPIAEIAERTGFRYFSYFSQCFRQMTGFSPGAYRGEKAVKATDERG